MRSLKTDLKQSKKSAYAEGTYKNLKVQWKSYFLFCVYFGFRAVPTETRVLCLFAEFLSRSFKSVASVRNYLSGVKLLHTFLDIPYVEYVNNFEVKLVLKGLARKNPYCSKQALPITPEILYEIYRILDLSCDKHAIFWCLFLFAFFLMARKSNFVPNSAATFDSNKQLTRGDVVEKDDMLLVDFKWSKTNQFGQRLLQIPLLSIPNSPLCPVKAFHHMCSLLPAHSSEPLFVQIKRKSRVSVTYRDLQNFLRECLRKCGKDPSLFSSHGFRRGGASYAFHSNVPAELIQLTGDWASDCY